MSSQTLSELMTSGIAILPDLVTAEQLLAMQRAFETRLRRLRWNNVDGYEKTERYRHVINDVLTLHQAFVDVALHPTVTEVVRAYVGPGFELVEAKGWKSLPTRRNFHGWHGDAWYDQDRVAGIPRELKLGVYLTDVRSGAFQYVQRTHGRQPPRPVATRDVPGGPLNQVVRVSGRAGLAFLFDTSGIHRQETPILEPRRAFFYDYHDPSVPIQGEDVAYHRYHPLLLNAAFLGGLSEEERRILGFGNKTNCLDAFERPESQRLLAGFMRSALDAKVHIDELTARVRARLSRLR